MKGGHCSCFYWKQNWVYSHLTWYRLVHGKMGKERQKKHYLWFGVWEFAETLSLRHAGGLWSNVVSVQRVGLLNPAAFETSPTLIHILLLEDRFVHLGDSSFNASYILLWLHSCWEGSVQYFDQREHTMSAHFSPHQQVLNPTELYNVQRLGACFPPLCRHTHRAAHCLQLPYLSQPFLHKAWLRVWMNGSVVMSWQSLQIQLHHHHLPLL